MREFIIDKTQKTRECNTPSKYSHCFLNMKELTPKGSPINVSELSKRKQTSMIKREITPRKSTCVRNTKKP